MGTFRLGAVSSILLCASLLAQKPAPSPAAAASSDAANAGDDIFAFTRLHKIHVSLTAAEWAVLQTSSPRNGGGQGGTDY